MYLCKLLDTFFKRDNWPRIEFVTLNLCPKLGTWRYYYISCVYPSWLMSSLSHFSCLWIVYRKCLLEVNRECLGGFSNFHKLFKIFVNYVSLVYINYYNTGNSIRKSLNVHNIGWKTREQCKTYTRVYVTMCTIKSVKIK